jgi:N-acetylglutamate synthase-like GNAT family acetyltransferase
MAAQLRYATDEHIIGKVWLTVMTRQQEFAVRKASVADSDGILECLLEAFEPYRERYTPEAFADTVLTPETLEQRLSTMSIFVATSMDGQIIGTIACNQLDTREGHIRGMAVRNAWHGGGAAQRLLETAENELQARGCQRISLDTTEPLQRAVSFYLKNGFKPTGTVSPFFGMPIYEYIKELTTTSSYFPSQKCAF